MSPEEEAAVSGAPETFEFPPTGEIRYAQSDVDPSLAGVSYEVLGPEYQKEQGKIAVRVRYPQPAWKGPSKEFVINYKTLEEWEALARK